MSRRFFLDVDSKITRTSQEVGNSKILLQKTKIGWDMKFISDLGSMDEEEIRVQLSTEQLRSLYRMLTLKENE